MRKLVYGALALSAALAVGFGVNANDADAANGYTTSWAVTQKGDSLTLKATNIRVDDSDITKPAGTIFVGEPKFAKLNNTDEGKMIAKATVATWEYYTASNGTAVVDLSKYAVGKDKWLLVKADFDQDSEAVLVKIPAASVLTTVKYVNGDLGAGKITVKNAAGEYSSGKLVAYTENGEEKALSEVSGTPGTYTVADIKDFQVNGASLYVREKGTDTATAVTPAEQTGTSQNPLVEVNANTKYKEVQVDGVKVKCITTLGARQSAAKKVSVTKLGNAPKLTVDYVNGKFTIKREQEYKIVKGSFAADATKVTKSVGGRVAIGEAELLSANKDFYIGTDFTSSADFAIDLRTVKTKNGVTTYSKWGRTTFKAQKDTALTYDVQTEDEDADETTTETVPYVSAKIRFLNDKKGYVIDFANVDTLYSYKVAAYAGSTKLDEVTIAKKGKKTITPKTAAKVTDPTAITKIEVTRLGNATTKELPNFTKELSNAYIETVMDGDTSKNFTVSLDESVATETNDVVLSQTTAKGDGSVVITVSLREVGEEDDPLEIDDLKDFKISYGAKVGTKAIKVSALKAAEKTVEDGKVVAFTFKMPAYNVTISQ